MSKIKINDLSEKNFNLLENLSDESIAVIQGGSKLSEAVKILGTLLEKVKKAGEGGGNWECEGSSCVRVGSPTIN